MGYNAQDIASKLSNSNWLSAKDLTGREVSVTVASVEIVLTEKDNGQSVDQLVLHFVGKDKKFGLNIINTNTMIALFGTDTDGWISNSIVLYTVPTQKGDGVRIKAVGPVSPSAPVTPQEVEQIINSPGF